MDDANLAMRVTVDATPEAAFAALVNVRDWWSTGVRGRSRELGDEFQFEVPGIHRCTMRVTEAVPGRRLAWTVEDSWLSFIERTDEWDGTSVVFDLRPSPGGTEIRFTHVGLTPSHECYDACATGWTHYVGESLRRLVQEGVGDPHVPDAGIKEFEQEALAKYA